jgi:hypothetical protein
MNGIRDDIQRIIEEYVQVERMTFDNGDFVFVYKGTRIASNLIMAKVYEYLESIDRE